jgi:uncharacterized protein HemX
MNISENQSRTLYAFFTLLFAINVGYTIWNFHEQQKLRKMQQKIVEEQLVAIKNSKKRQVEEEM